MQPERSAEGLAGSGGRRGRSARNPGPPHSSPRSRVYALASLPARTAPHALPRSFPPRGASAPHGEARVRVCERRTDGPCAFLSPFPSLPGSLSHTRTSKVAFTIREEKRRRRLRLKSLAPRRNKNKPLESAGVLERRHARALLLACLSTPRSHPLGVCLSGG